MVKIIENIERLAFINAAGNMIRLGQELRDERQIIVNYLKIENVIELEEKGGFYFINENSDKYKEIYLDNYNNF